MKRYNYERLTALDNSFLLLERPNTQMHVASVAIHDAGPLRLPGGAIDLDQVRKSIASVLHRIPRYRQKLAWIPVDSSPIWVDDTEFNIDYHLRHTSLPRPGDESQLRALAARVMAQHLDRSRPLWECWVVEGLSGDRIALINKTHHCMVDGVSGVDLMNIIMNADPHAAPADETPPFIPRQAPAGSDLLRDELVRRITLPLAAIQDIRKLVEEARDRRREFVARLRSVAHTLGTTLRPASPTPLNGRIGPHRRFHWTAHEIDELKTIRKHCGGSLNDVVLAIVSGAVQRFLRHRRVDPGSIDFRVMTPVSVRKTEERGSLGNRVSAWFIPLPVGVSDSVQRLRNIAEQTHEMKESKSAVGAELLTQAAEWTPATLLSLGARNMTRLQAFNLVVTNVPGPQVPLYLLGARLQEVYPMVPLADGQGLGIALFSYDGKLFWGFNADYELLPDLPRFVEFVQEAYEELREAARRIAEVPPPEPGLPDFAQEHRAETGPATSRETARPAEPATPGIGVANAEADSDAGAGAGAKAGAGAEADSDAGAGAEGAADNVAHHQAGPAADDADHAADAKAASAAHNNSANTSDAPADTDSTPGNITPGNTGRPPQTQY